MNKVINISSYEFTQEVEKFLATIPESGDVEGVTLTLLLFHSFKTQSYFWCLLMGTTVAQEVEGAMSVDQMDSHRGVLMPLGVVRLYGSRRPEGRISFDAKWWIHPTFVEHEVEILNGTVPHFLSEAFADAYKLTSDGKPQNILFEKNRRKPEKPDPLGAAMQDDVSQMLRSEKKSAKLLYFTRIAYTYRGKPRRAFVFLVAADDDAAAREIERTLPEILPSAEKIEYEPPVFVPVATTPSLGQRTESKLRLSLSDDSGATKQMMGTRVEKRK